MPTIASVIILNWNRGKDVVELIKKLEKQTFKDFETIVVDNHSSDDSLASIRAKFPHVGVVKLNKNYGKAGFNFGMREAKGKYLIMFDSDALPSPDVIGKYLQKLKANQKIGLVCPAVYIAKEYFGPAYNAKKLENGGADVLFFCGTSVATKREVFERVGGYEERFFLCLEELEWATRVSLAGYQVKVFPDIKVINKKTEKGSDYRRILGYYYCRNWIWFYIKYLPFKYIPTFLLQHVKSFFIKTTAKGSMRKTDCLRGLLASITKAPQFLKERRPLSKYIIERVKLDLFPNPYHLYIK